MANWWESGKRFRTVVTRQVTEEETISLEALADTLIEAEKIAESFAKTAHGLMRAYNKTVHGQLMRTYRQQERAIEARIAEKSAQLAALGETVVEPAESAVNGQPWGD